MSFKCADRIKEITTTEGTGAIQLEGAVSGFKAFSSYLINNDTTYYSIEDTLGNWENGFGTYQTGTPDSILRTNIISSSNNNLIVNFATGNKNIFCTNPADGTALIQDDGVSNRLIETDADITTTGALTCGTFTSTGIDDNATAERVQVADGALTIGPDDTSFYKLQRRSETGVLRVQGGWGSNDAQIWLYGGSHATNASDIRLLSSASTDQLVYDDSASSWDFQANDITTTGEIIANGAASYVGIGPNQNIAYGDLVIGFPAGSNSSICLRESEVGGADFRMIAVASDNSARLSNYGTGEMNFANINADNFSFYTSNTSLELRFTESTNTWDFQANDITTTGSIIQTSGGIETKTQGGLGFGAIQSLVTGSSPQIVWAIKNDTADLRFGVGTGGDAYFLNYSDNNRLDFRNMSVAGGAETNVWRFSTSNATYAQLYFDTTDMNSDSAGTWDFSGNDITTTGEVSGAHINLKATTVASLPAAGSNTGDMYRVTDANAPSMGATVSGGGSANAMVWSNGTNWTVFGI